MKRGPQGGRSGTDFTRKAREAWGETLPDEVAALAREATATSGSAAARRIGYSPAVVSHLTANRYPGDLVQVFARIRGALMGETLMCPILGEIGLDRCLSEQKRPFAATNSTRARLYHACKSCQHRRDGQ